MGSSGSPDVSFSVKIDGNIAYGPIEDIRVWGQVSTLYERTRVQVRDLTPPSVTATQVAEFPAHEALYIGTMSEVADYFGVHYTTVSRWVRFAECDNS